MLFFFGYGTKQKQMGLGQVRACGRCHNTSQWIRLREFKQFTVFFIPVARWKRRNLEVCGICGAAVAV
ncbi:zinc-ribbon domain-containing protein [Mycobacterium sp. pW049]|uniref:zinc-ribbon domain-containing protein n=1 Tax=[Mycobacterium] bulgaricum TaxID=3238985 RepID=UPI00351B0619